MTDATRPCGATCRMFGPDVRCERPHGHAGTHRGVDRAGRRAIGCQWDAAPRRRGARQDVGIDLGDGVRGVATVTGPLTDRDRDELARFKDYLAGQRGAPTLGPAEARAYVGLSAGQAAKLLGVPRALLEAIESGALVPDDLLRARYERMVDTRVRWPERTGGEHG